MPEDEHSNWMGMFRALLKRKPKKAKPKPPPSIPAAPGFGPARSIGPVAPVMRQAEQAALGQVRPGTVPLAEMMITAPPKRPKK